MTPSRIKILPSDVVLMIVDYLDSVTLMNCREVCKTWLDVVDGNRFLWDYFYIENQECSLNMLNLFAIRSNHSIKVFDATQGPRKRFIMPIFPFGAKKKRSNSSNELLEILLKSKESLQKLFFASDEYDNEVFQILLVESLQFPNLQSFSLQSTAAPTLPVRIIKRIKRIPFEMPTTNTAPLFQIRFHPRSSLEGQMNLILASQSNLLHLETSHPNVNSVLFLPTLTILNILDYRNDLFACWTCPRLKRLILTLEPTRKTYVVSNFPQSLEEICLKATARGSNPGIKRGGLDSLKKNYPKLEEFIIDVGVGFYADEAIKMVKARKLAAKKGLEVDGIEMSPIKSLSLDFGKLDLASLEKLKELVPEVKDIRTGLPDLEIEIVSPNDEEEDQDS